MTWVIDESKRKEEGRKKKKEREREGPIFKKQWVGVYSALQNQMYFSKEICLQK